MFSGGGAAVWLLHFRAPGAPGLRPGPAPFCCTLTGAGHALRACGAPYITASPAALLIKAAAL